MSIKLIADSSCDLTPALKEQLDIALVSFKVILGDKEFVDNKDLDVLNMLDEIKAHSSPVASACPSPDEFATHMEAADESFVITLSSKLSGSYNSAVVARELVLEKHPDKKIHVFDSKSAAAGETRIALLLHEMINAGKAFDEIVKEAEQFIAGMCTRFVLDDLGTLIKNGRISKAAGFVGSVLNLRPIMAGIDGEIVALEKVRGTQNAMIHLVQNVAAATVDAAKSSKTLVLTHCNCAERARELTVELMAKCAAIKEIVFIPTAGLSSMYANNGGIILAF